MPAGRAGGARPPAAIGITPASACTASCSRAAAFPVGAARATRGGGRDRRGGLLVEEGQDPRHRRRLAGARPAGDDGEAALDGGGRGEALQVAFVVAEQPRQPGRQHVRIDVGRTRRAAAGEVGGDAALLPPVALEVQARARRGAAAGRAVRRRRRRRAGWLRAGSSSRRRRATAAARRRPGRRDRSSPCAGRSPRRCRRGRGGGAHGQRRGEQHGLVVVAAEHAQALGDVDVGGGQHAGLVEGAQDARRRGGRVGRRKGRAQRSPPARRSCAPRPRSRRSLTARTRRRRGPPGEHAARLPVDDRYVGTGHAAQEQVQGAAQVTVGGVAGQPPPQVAVQGDDVEQRLQRVVGVLHGGGERLGPVVPCREVLAVGAEPVRLVVDDDEALAPIDRPARAARRRGCPSGSRAAAGRGPDRGAGRRTRRAGRRRGRGRRARRRGRPASAPPPARPRPRGGARTPARRAGRPVRRRAAGGRRRATRAGSRWPGAARRRRHRPARRRRDPSPAVARAARSARHRGRRP